LLGRLPALRRAEVVHREVVRDAEQPRGERRRAPAELPDRLEHLQEGLRRQVLGVVAVADAHVEVAVDAVEVDEVELFERLAVAALRTVDEAADDGRLRLLPARRSAHALSGARGAGGLTAGSKADAALAGEALDEHDLRDGDRIAAVLGLEAEALVCGAHRAVDVVRRRRRDVDGQRLAALERDLEADAIELSHPTPAPRARLRR